MANTGAQPGTWIAYGDVYGIGGNPMADGPFTNTMADGSFIGYSANFNIGTISITGYDPNAMLPPNCEGGFYDGGYICPVPGEVPIPAAAWLFGSGLLGLLGVARRRMI